MIISMIAAASVNNVIGSEGDMPWHMPADLKYFKRTTLNHHIIMGRQTFESFGNGRPLPRRVNVVLTRQANYSREGVTVCDSIEKALQLAREAGEDEAFIIGGGSIYKQALSMAHRIYLTRIHTQMEGDTFFPALNEEWGLISREKNLADEKNPFDYDFEVWERLIRSDAARVEI